ncbi:PEP/pyruvate-binding domain-containing protein [Cellulomonas sp. Leaf334]|uniref:PEP/pyruvate-binding domain-containing protein n=1 Tax=Cellulomonas sp. Leaf334 TaxID=1736339 RepID=UPI0006F8EA16|nr:PEP/pyruvate-binding domain-containing protein [Cellulomonas sp. Leaf334]KQR17328.1 pyruvate phosphate dikinase [Cellulomonas sp. Leaf334]
MLSTTLVPLHDAVPRTCGGKAGALGALLRAGLPVPDGFVLPIAYRPVDGALPDDLRAALGSAPVAVRSSADDEDTGLASAAGQYESALGVQGVDAVVDAVRACWASLHSARAVAYRGASATSPRMAVLVQRHLDAEVSGVMFTPGGPGGPTQIEASWGLGPSVVGGTVTPDAYRVDADGTVTRTVADKRTRLDRRGTQVVTSDVPEPDRRRPTLDDATAAGLAGLGRSIAAVLGGPQDVEWALVGGDLWVLQARPTTADLPERPSRPVRSPATLVGTPGSSGTATGTARVVRGPGDFAGVRPGDILVCPWTDPSWTPLLRLAAGVVTETGGVLSHAAIVARERRIPAVLGITGATTTLHDATTLTVDGTAGTVTRHR